MLNCTRCTMRLTVGSATEYGEDSYNEHYPQHFVKNTIVRCVIMLNVDAREDEATSFNIMSIYCTLSACFYNFLSVVASNARDKHTAIT